MRAFGTIFALTLIAGCDSPAAIPAPARIVHDLGRIDPSMGEVRQVFRLRNLGSKTWHFSRVVPSCVCINLDKRPFSVAPGAEHRVPVRLGIAELNGRFSYNVRLFADANPTGIVDLIVKGQVIRRVSVTPPVIDLGPVASGSAFRRDVLVNASVDGIQLAVDGHRVLRFEIVSRDRLEPGRFTIVVTGTVPDHKGSFAYVAMLRVSGSIEETVALRVQGKAATGLEAIPSFVMLSPSSKAIVQLFSPTGPLPGEPDVRGVPANVAVRIDSEGGQARRVVLRRGAKPVTPGTYTVTVRLGDEMTQFTLEVPAKHAD